MILDRSNIHLVQWILALFLIPGCFLKQCDSKHEKLSPEEVVQAYLDVSFNMRSVEEREKLMQYTSGSLKEALLSASDENIREAYVDPRYVLERYTVLERRDRTPRETEITFEVVYRNMGKEGEDDTLKPEEIPTVSVENTVSVVRENQVWVIREVLNKKSSFFFPVSPETMTIKPGNP